MQSAPEDYIIVAETAFSHEGDFCYLRSQVDAAVAGGADCIKFQVFLNKESYYAPCHPSLERIDPMMFSEAEWERIFLYASGRKIRILVLPLNVESLRFARQFDEIIHGYEIHSVCFNEWPLLKIMRETSRNIILGVGGRLPQEIDYVLRILQKSAEKVVLMSGFQSFPTDCRTLNLGKLLCFRDTFRCIMGYADHSSFDDGKFTNYVNYAYLLGARWFEKHVVPDPGVKRVDFESAVGVEGLRVMRNELDTMKTILGDGNIFHLNDAELLYRNREKQLAAKRDLPVGHVLCKEDIGFFVTERAGDIDQGRYPELLGRRLTRPMKKGEPFRLGGME